MMRISRLIQNTENIHKIIDMFTVALTNQIIEASVDQVTYNSVLQFVIIDKLKDMVLYIEGSDIFSIQENVSQMEYLLKLLKTKRGDFDTIINNIKKTYLNICTIIPIIELIQTDYVIPIEVKNNFDKLTRLSTRYRTTQIYTLQILNDMIAHIKTFTGDDLFDFL